MIKLVDLLEQNSPAELAHQNGWVSGGWGTWKDASGNTVAKTVAGKLVPVEKLQGYEREEDLDAFSQSIRDKYNPKSFEVYINPNTAAIQLSRIIVGNDNQGKGIGTKIMDDLISYADAHGKKITLTPMEKNKEHGTTSPTRLKKFYKRFGFVPNAGRHKDFSISDSMIRYPSSR